MDSATGQYYLRARFYNPVIGRFTQQDTYHGDGLDLYAYCQNNPVMYCDPTGHDSGSAADKAWQNYIQKGADAMNSSADKGANAMNNYVDKGTNAMNNAVNNSSGNQNNNSLKQKKNEQKKKAEEDSGSRTGNDVDKKDNSNDGKSDNGNSRDNSGTLAKGKIEHVLKNHTYDRMKATIDNLMKKGLRGQAEKLLQNKSFFNPSWSEQKVTDAVNQAYNRVISQGFTDGTHTVTVFGEKISVYLENGILHTAYGNYKFTLSDFGY